MRGDLRMQNSEGRDLPLDLEQLKGIFFVRDYQGNKEYLEDKNLNGDPERKGLRVRIRFEDNETMEGVIENSLEILQENGFFFWPERPESQGQQRAHLRREIISAGFSSPRGKILSAPVHNYGQAPRKPRRPSGKARGVSNIWIYDRRATQLDVMYGVSNVSVIVNQGT